MYKIIKPAWAFDYNQSSGTYSNVPISSRENPSYTYYNINSAVYKNNHTAFIQNAQAGVCGQGIAFYGSPNSQSPYITDYTNHRDLTHAWSMAIPITMGAPIGIFTAQFNAGVFYPPNYNVIGPNLQTNFVWYIDKDHILKLGSTYNNGAYGPPFEMHNFGVDMSAYMYTPLVGNMDAYCGHRYVMSYNSSNRSYDLYIDNTAAVIASAPEDLFVQEALHIMNTPVYWEWYYVNGGAIRNYYYTGPGAYMSSNSSIGLNIYLQGNVYMSDWYGWEVSLNKDEIQAVIDYDWKTKKEAVISSSLSPFCYCNELSAITIPPVDKIGQYMMQYCNNLTEVAISNGVNVISSEAFYTCRNISTVTIPESVNVIYSNSFYESNNITEVKISANCPMYDNMFSSYTDMNNIAFYQQPQQLVAPVYHVPGIMSKRTRTQEIAAYKADLKCSPIEFIKLSNNEICTAPKVAFNGTVDANAMLSYTAGSAIIKEENATAVLYETTSIREHNLKATYSVNKATTEGFNVYSVTKASAAIDTHVNNTFSTVPMLIENHWAVCGVYNVTSNTDVIIECLPEINNILFDDYTFSSDTHGMPYIYDCFHNAPNVTIKNAYDVHVANSFNNCTGTVTFENCDLVVISSGFNNSNKPVFINCNKVASMLPVNTADEFDALLNQKYTFLYGDMNVNTVSSDLVIGPNIYGYPYINYVSHANIFDFATPGNIVVGAVLNNITVNNVTNLTNGPFFTDCTGDFNLHIYGDTLNTTNCFINNHTGMGNVYVDVNYVPNIPHGIVYNSTLSSVHFKANSVELESNAGSAYMFYNTKVNSVSVDCDTIPPYFMFNANVNTAITTTATRVGAYAFTNCNLKASTTLPSILNSCTYIGVEAFRRAVLPSSDLSLNGNIAPSAFAEITGVQNLFINTTSNTDATVSESSLNVASLTNVDIICTANAQAINVYASNASIINIAGYRRVLVNPDASKIQRININDSCTNVVLGIGVNGLTQFNLPRYCLNAHNTLSYLTNISDIWVNPNANLYGLPASVTVHYYEDIPISYNSTVMGDAVIGDALDLSTINVVGVYKNAESEVVEFTPLITHYMPSVPVAAGREGIICFSKYNTAPRYNAAKYSAVYSGGKYIAKSGTAGVMYIMPSNYTMSFITNIAPYALGVPIKSLTILGYEGVRLNWTQTSNTNYITELAILSNNACINGTRGVFTNHQNLTYVYTRQNMLNAVNAYMNCRNLKAVDLSAITQQYMAGTNTFRNCTNLMAVLAPNNSVVNTIGANAFCGCNNLLTIDLSAMTNTSVSIMTNAFRNCNRLRSVVLPSGLTSVAAYAFYNTALKSVSIPTGCTVGSSAFPSDCVITYI